MWQTTNRVFVPVKIIKGHGYMDAFLNIDQVQAVEASTEQTCSVSTGLSYPVKGSLSQILKDFGFSIPPTLKDFGIPDAPTT